MKRALITGVAGQDGYYLAKLLASNGYQVYGVGLSLPDRSSDLMSALTDAKEIDVAQGSIFADYVRQIRPEEIYHLAAHHFSSQSGENRTGQVSPFLTINVTIPNMVLEILHEELPGSRFFYAASSHIFGLPEVSPQTELTPHRPETPYAITKSAGVQLCRYYRNTHHLYTVSGILYNHESMRRSESFITTQIARAAALAHYGKPSKLVVRSIDAIVDWGAAEDYVRAMWLAMQQQDGDDYIIASGIPRTVHDFASVAFSHLGLNADDYVFQDGKADHHRTIPFIGDSSKIRRTCNWQPLISFDDLVRSMVDYQISEFERKINGK